MYEGFRRHRARYINYHRNKPKPIHRDTAAFMGSGRKRAKIPRGKVLDLPKRQRAGHRPDIQLPTQVKRPSAIEFARFNESAYITPAWFGGRMPEYMGPGMSAFNFVPPQFRRMPDAPSHY